MKVNDSYWNEVQQLLEIQSCTHLDVKKKQNPNKPSKDISIYQSKCIVFSILTTYQIKKLRPWPKLHQESHSPNRSPAFIFPSSFQVLVFALTWILQSAGHRNV